jgi:hypothetical protein
MIAAKGDLVAFYARTIQSKNADMTDVVVPTGIDAARDFDLQRADVMFDLQLIKTGRNLLGNRYRTGRRQCTVIHAGTGDDVGGEADVGCRKICRPQF